MSLESDEVISRLSSISMVGNLLDRMDESLSVGFIDKNLDPLKATTKKHCLETAEFFYEVIRNRGYENERNEALILGALLHDAGKAFIPASYLYSSEPMDADAIRLMKCHSETGAEIIYKISEFDLSSEKSHFKNWQWDTAIALTSLHHNFKNEAKYCYPKDSVLEDLQNRKIVSSQSINAIQTSGLGEMFAVCDVFSAVSAGRPYSKRRLEDESLSCPDDFQDIVERSRSISDVVRYELRLSKLGETALDRLFEYYCTRF